MNKIMKCLTGVILGIALIAMLPATKAYASSSQFWLDFGETTMSIPAGSEHTMWLRSDYNYTYYVEGATSSGTYCECSYKSGSQNVTFHIGADEQAGNIFFHFYADDERLQSEDAHDCVEVYVQGIKPASTTLPVTIAKGKTGSLVQNDKISMLYNEKGVAMASFSLTKGKGVMASYAQTGVVSNGASYFGVSTSDKNATPVISESDKAVMLANGYAGVCINGKYVNWP
ncbi:hypothetical protein [Butyrivibrio sp. VCB2001]|uniref:hypothetical protein n=1 Tax=Butyrivibrio sp. VCB2001 TaxID=1280667 RepID=UPI0003F82A85|nr:hypothetical protein [Butyrivibrio sp. VCB2001]